MHTVDTGRPTLPVGSLLPLHSSSSFLDNQHKTRQYKTVRSTHFNSFLMWRGLIVPAEVITTRRTTRRPSSSSSSSSASVTSVRLYRVLSRQIQQLPNDFLLQRPLKSRDYGRALIHSPSSHQGHDAILNTFRCWHGANDWYDSITMNPMNTTNEESQQQQRQRQQQATDASSPSPSCWTTRVQLREAVQLAFRTAPATMQRYAVQAFQDVVEQLSLWKASSVSGTHGIRIVALSSYSGEELSGSIHPETKYRFKYRIRVENVDSKEPVQLLGRTWRIQDLDATGNHVGDPVMVNAPTTGVGEWGYHINKEELHIMLFHMHMLCHSHTHSYITVGHQPVLHQGQVFEYMSGCHLSTKQGRMGGSLHMAVVSPNTPDAQVGDVVEALQPEFQGPILEISVATFGLFADGGDHTE